MVCAILILTISIATTPVVKSQSIQSQQWTHHEQCEICSLQNSTLRTATIPSQLSNSERPIFLAEDVLSSTVNISTMTCGDWQSYIDAELLKSKEFCSLNDTQYCHDFCLSFENWLEYSCCEGALLPRYQCQELVRNSALISHDDGIPYDIVVAPLAGDYSAGINVYVTAEISEYKIINYGVDGGAIEVVLTTTEEWVDERLHWDPQSVGGCTQIHVQASLDPLESDIWVPGRGTVIKHDFSSSDATVLADGTVKWERQLQIEATCKTIWDHVTKRCTFSFSSDEGGLWAEDGINYIVGSHYDVGKGNFNGGVSVQDISTLPGYVLNKNLTFLSAVSDERSDSMELILDMHFDPLVTKCYLCGGIEGETLRSDKIPVNNNDGGHLALSPDVDGWTCQQIEDFLTTSHTVNDTMCDVGREYFTEACCEGIPSRYTCEKNIRSIISEKLEGDVISPPDPYPAGSSMIDVEVLLDFLHIIDIDIRLNTLEVLVSLELIWHDDRLKWDPFVGGCNVVSYVASPGEEINEIWAPEIDLLDQVEGAEGLPQSSAIVFQDGLVWWKRTGVLNVACDLTGLKWFPFDQPSCNMDFGATRSPLAHRVNYTGLEVVFSEHLKERTGKYHEYHVISQRSSNITMESEALPSYVNNFIRYKFFFERASSYYLWTFIILYIFFTYLSFGMFFLDQQVGERLGFGTGILFVIVAQDITIWERTPITQIQLWINYLSFTSKVFVILGIVESVAILYYYFINDLDGDGKDNVLEAENNEVEDLISRNRNSIINNEDANYDDNDDSIYHSENGKVYPGGVSDNENTLTADGTYNDSNQSVREFNENVPSQSIRRSLKDRRYSRRSSVNLMLGKKASWWVKNVLRYEVYSTDSLTKQKILKLRLWDRLTAFLFFGTYTLFLVIMFIIAYFHPDDN